MAISWNGKEHRYSLHKLLDKPLSYFMSRTEAEAHRDRFRSEIRLGTFRGLAADASGSPGDPSALTFGDVVDRYLEGHVRLPHRRAARNGDHGAPPSPVAARYCPRGRYVESSLLNVTESRS